MSVILMDNTCTRDILLLWYKQEGLAPVLKYKYKIFFCKDKQIYRNISIKIAHGYNNINYDKFN